MVPVFVMWFFFRVVPAGDAPGEGGDPPSAHDRAALVVAHGQAAEQGAGAAELPEGFPGATGAGGGVPDLGHGFEQPGVGHRQGAGVGAEDVDAGAVYRPNRIVPR